MDRSIDQNLEVSFTRDYRTMDPLVAVAPRTPTKLLRGALFFR